MDERHSGFLFLKNDVEINETPLHRLLSFRIM